MNNPHQFFFKPRKHPFCTLGPLLWKLVEVQSPKSILTLCTDKPHHNANGQGHPRHTFYDHNFLWLYQKLNQIT